MTFVNNEKLNQYINDFLIALVVILIYLMFPTIQSSVLSLLDINFESLPKVFQTIILIIFSLIEMAILILIYKNSLKKDLKDIKKNHKSYFNEYFKYWLIIIFVMLISNALIFYFFDSVTSKNEMAFYQLTSNTPIYAYFSGVIFAPLIEELIYRRSLRNMIPNDKLFIFVSGIIFGGLHVLTGFSGPVDLLYLIGYCTPGVIFAYILTKTDNVLVSTGIHFMHNGILVAAQVFIYLFLT